MTLIPLSIPASVFRFALDKEASLVDYSYPASARCRKFFKSYRRYLRRFNAHPSAEIIELLWDKAQPHE